MLQMGVTRVLVKAPFMKQKSSCSKLRLLAFCAFNDLNQMTQLGNFQFPYLYNESINIPWSLSSFYLCLCWAIKLTVKNYWIFIGGWLIKRLCTITPCKILLFTETGSSLSRIGRDRHCYPHLTVLETAASNLPETAARVKWHN